MHSLSFQIPKSIQKLWDTLGLVIRKKIHNSVVPHQLGSIASTRLRFFFPLLRVENLLWIDPSTFIPRDRLVIRGGFSGTSNAGVKVDFIHRVMERHTDLRYRSLEVWLSKLVVEVG